MKKELFTWILVLCMVAPLVSAATTISNVGTVGIDDATDSDNLFSTSASAGAGQDLYWGNRLLCTAASTDCGSDGIDGLGAANRLLVWSDTTIVGNSSLSDDGSTLSGNNIVVSGALNVNGDDLTSDNNLDLSATGYVYVDGTGGSLDTANGDDDLYVVGDMEMDGQLYVHGAGTSVFAGTVDVTDLTADDHAIGPIGTIHLDGGDLEGLHYQDGSTERLIAWTTSLSHGETTVDGMVFSWLDGNSQGFRWCNPNECGMELESNTGEWDLTVADGMNIGDDLLVQGTSSIAGPLYLNGGTTGAAPTAQLDFNSYYDNAGDVSISHLQLYTGYGFGVSNGQLDIISNSATAFMDGTSTRMYVESGGQVGVQQTSPSALLHIGDTSTSDGEMLVESSAGRIGVLESDDDTNWIHIGTQSNHNFYFVRNDVQLMYIDSSIVNVNANVDFDVQGYLRACDGGCSGVTSEDGQLIAEYGILGEGTFNYMNYNGGDGDSSIYFYNGGSPTAERIYWDNSADDFVFTDALESGGGQYTQAQNHFLLNSDGGDADSMVYFYEANSETGERIFWNNANHRFQIGDAFTISGSITKTGSGTFIQQHPYDPALSIRYYFFEGPHEGAYNHGKANLTNGVAYVAFPHHFRSVLNNSRLYAQVTPHGEDSLGLGVESIDENGMTVRELLGGTGSYEFSYFIHTDRLGYEEVPIFEESSYIPQDKQVDRDGNYLEFSDENDDNDIFVRDTMVQNGLLNPDHTINRNTFAAYGLRIPISREDTEVLSEYLDDSLYETMDGDQARLVVQGAGPNPTEESMQASYDAVMNS